MLGTQKRWQEELFVAGPLSSLIPDDHILKRVDKILDLSWLRDEVKDLYCADKGSIEGPIANPDSVVRNIFYAHVPSSICSLVCFTVLLVTSIGFLSTSKLSWDIVAEASAQVGIVFATVLNITGSIFSRAEWGPWWTPSYRLVTAASYRHPAN